MKYFYLINFWVPFPSSEYGGFINVIAQNNQECHDILQNWRYDHYEEYDSLIMEEVTNAERFALAEDEESRVVDCFVT